MSVTLEVLREIAKREGHRPSPCLDYDPNVCTFSASPDNPADLRIVLGQPFTKKVSFKRHQHRIRIEASSECILVIILADLSIAPLGMNAPNKMFRMRRANNGFTYSNQMPIYTESGRIDDDQKYLLADSRLQRLAGDLTQDEFILFSRADIRIYLRRVSVARVEDCTQLGIDIVKMLENKGEVIDWSALPAALQDLIPLAESFGITDDQVREEVRNSATREALRSAVEYVKPRLAVINRYLDSFGDKPLSEAAISLQALAEFVVEAESYLDRSKSER